MQKRSASKALTRKGQQSTSLTAHTLGGGLVNIVAENPWTVLGATVMVAGGFYLGWEARGAVGA